MSLTEYELARRVAERCGLTIQQAVDIGNVMFDEIRKALQAGESFSKRKFGSFHVVDLKTRRGTNPRTLEPITVEGSKKVRFTGSRILRSGL